MIPLDPSSKLLDAIYEALLFIGSFITLLIIMSVYMLIVYVAIFKVFQLVTGCPATDMFDIK